MKKQITSLIILTALVNFTTHAMERRIINNKKSYMKYIFPQPPRKKQTPEEFLREIINDKSQTTYLLADIMIRDYLHRQELTEYILAK